MKYKYLTVLFATLMLTACGAKDQPTTEAETTMVETTAEETTVAETTAEETTTEETNKKTTVVETTVAEITVSETTTATETQPKTGSLNPRKNITKNEDGTYSYTDEFLIAIQEIDGVANLNQAQLEEMLANITPILFEMPTEADIIALISSEVAWYEWGDFVEETGFGKEKPSQETNNTASTNGGHGQVNTEQDTQEIYVPEVKGEWDDFFSDLEESSGTHAKGDGSHVGISHSTQNDVIAPSVPEVKGEYDDTFVFEDGSVHTHAPGDGSHVGISHQN